VRETKGADLPVEFHAPERGPATPTEQVRGGSMTRTSSYDCNRSITHTLT